MQPHHSIGNLTHLVPMSLWARNPWGGSADVPGAARAPVRCSPLNFPKQSAHYKRIEKRKCLSGPPVDGRNAFFQEKYDHLHLRGFTGSAGEARCLPRANPVNLRMKQILWPGFHMFAKAHATLQNQTLIYVSEGPPCGRRRKRPLVKAHVSVS